MIKNNPGSSPDETFTGMSENSLSLDAIKKLTNLGVNRETAVKLADLRHDMHPVDKEALKTEFSQLSETQQQEKITQIHNVLQELRQQIVTVSTFEASQLRKSLNVAAPLDSHDSPIKETFGGIASSLRQTALLSKDFIIGFQDAILHPIESARYIYYQADGILEVHDLAYTIPEENT